VIDLEAELVDLDGFETLDRELYAPTIAELTRLTRMIENEFDPPQWVVKDSRKQWVYRSTGREYIVIQRLFRGISALNACRFLIPNCFVAEMGVLLRTINEFEEDIVFLLENYPEEQSEDQKTFIQENLKPMYRNRDIPFEGLESPAMVPRKKVVAATRRRVASLSNPHDAQKLASITGDLFSAYVHGAFEANMDLYGFDGQVQSYQVSGLRSDRARFDWIQQLLLQLERQVFAVEYVGQILGPVNVHQEAGALRKWYAEAANKFGYYQEFENKNPLADLKAGRALRAKRPS